MFWDKQNVYPAVLYSCWRALDGSAGLIAVNISEHVQESVWRVSEGYGRTYREITGDGKQKRIDRCVVKTAIDGQDAYVIEIAR